MNIDDIIGMTKADAIALLKEHSISYRVRSTDGVAHIGTADLRPDRVNLFIADGKITSYRFG